MSSFRAYINHSNIKTNYFIVDPRSFAALLYLKVNFRDDLNTSISPVIWLCLGGDPMYFAAITYRKIAKSSRVTYFSIIFTLSLSLLMWCRCTMHYSAYTQIKSDIFRFLCSDQIYINFDEILIKRWEKIHLPSLEIVSMWLE